MEILAIILLGHNGSSKKVGSCSPIQITAFCNTDFPPLSFKVIDELLLLLIDFEKTKKRNSPSMNAAATHTEEEQEFFFLPPPPPLVSSALADCSSYGERADGRTENVS